MLRIISKQAQYLTINDDAGLMQPYRQIGQGLKRHIQNRVREKRRLQWEKQWGGMTGNFANGTCRTPGCGQALAVGPRGRRFCPKCNPPRPPGGSATV